MTVYKVIFLSCLLAVKIFAKEEPLPKNSYENPNQANFFTAPLPSKLQQLTKYPAKKTAKKIQRSTNPKHNNPDQNQRNNSDDDLKTNFSLSLIS